jgi:hypothetical protein
MLSVPTVRRQGCPPSMLALIDTTLSWVITSA